MINAFTIQDLKRIAKKIYKSDNLLFVVVGDLGDSDKRISLLKY
jgi:predicted Zn-dependent peptidase